MQFVWIFLVVYYITYYVTLALIEIVKWTFILLFLLVGSIYSGGVRLAGPAGGIGAVLAVLLAAAGITIAVVLSSAPNATMVESAAASSPEEAQSEQYSQYSSETDTMVMESGSPSEEAQSEQSPSSSLSSSEEKLRAAVQAYYEAVDREDWNYAYDNLDSRTKQKYTRDEYVDKNLYLASVDPLAHTSPEITSEVSTSSPVEVTLDQTFESGLTKSRVTYFVWEGGAWKRRFSQEDDAIFLPDASYDEFVWAKQSG